MNITTEFYFLFGNISRVSVLGLVHSTEQNITYILYTQVVVFFYIC